MIGAMSLFVKCCQTYSPRPVQRGRVCAVQAETSSRRCANPISEPEASERRIAGRAYAAASRTSAAAGHVAQRKAGMMCSANSSI